MVRRRVVQGRGNGIGLAVALAVILGAAAPRPARAAICDSNLMIVLDRSCSMRQPVSDTDTRTKWAVAKLAIEKLTTDYLGDLRYGLIMFPDTTGVDCVQDGPIYVNVGPGNEAAVVAAIAGTTPTGPCVTNIDTAVNQVAVDPVFQALVDPTGRRSFVLLLSDGAQSGTCGGNAADPLTVQNLQVLYQAGFPTFVIGFGGAVDPTALDQFAVAGGVPRDGTPRYWQADDAAGLELAFDEIAGKITSDPEFGCPGTPCPDGRCFGANEACVENVCQLRLPDGGGPAGGADAATGGGDGGGGGGGGGDDAPSVCGCATGRAAGAPAAARGQVGTGLLAALLALATRRRRRGACRTR